MAHLKPHSTCAFWSYFNKLTNEFSEDDGNKMPLSKHLLYLTWSPDNGITGHWIFRLKSLINVMTEIFKRHWMANINSGIHSHYHWKGQMLAGHFSGHSVTSTWYLPIVRKHSWVDCLVTLENPYLPLIGFNLWNYISQTPLQLSSQKLIKFIQGNAQMCGLSLELN